MGSVLFHLLISDLPVETVCTFSRSTDNTELGGATDTPGGWLCCHSEGPPQAAEKVSEESHELQPRQMQVLHIHVPGWAGD